MQKSRVALKCLESVPSFHSFANLFSQHVLQEHRLLFFLFILPRKTWEEITQAFYQTELPSLLHLTGAGLAQPQGQRSWAHGDCMALGTPGVLPHGLPAGALCQRSGDSASREAGAPLHPAHGHSLFRKDTGGLCLCTRGVKPWMARQPHAHTLCLSFDTRSRTQVSDSIWCAALDCS